MRKSSYFLSHFSCRYSHGHPGVASTAPYEVLAAITAIKGHLQSSDHSKENVTIMAIINDIYGKCIFDFFLK